MMAANRDKTAELIANGVSIPNPECVLVGQEVSVNRIAKGVVVYPGCKIMGKETLIMPGVELGYEGPVTVEDCQIGPNVALKSGFFKKSVFLEKACMGSSALVREGCLLEEQANGAHCVGLKQTILFPFVTLGSLINFCDCFMGGGTSRENHSEVGSSYIHFNYTPNQDKATASLIGDVPRGVMLNCPPIFLGGQGGLVGPVRINYGTVVAAGVICRNDLLEGGKLVLSQDMALRYSEKTRSSVNFHPGVYWHVKGQVINNLYYLANMIALKHWYTCIRSKFFRGDVMVEALFSGAVDKVDMAIKERIKRFKALAHKMPDSVNKYQSLQKKRADDRLVKQKQEFFAHWNDLESLFEKHQNQTGDPKALETFLNGLEKSTGNTRSDYIAAIQGLSESVALQGTAWLQGIVDTMMDETLECLPSLGR
jgi:UDP-N-acetylglucosamine/UDP-N-acetylgalactosamine diphosphorylase